MGLLTGSFLVVSGCGLWSIDPDTIDVADEEVGMDDAGGTADEALTNGDTGSEDTGPDDSNGTDTAADETTTEDRTTDATDDGTTGDGDGDTDTGTTGETGDPGCVADGEVMLGENAVVVVDTMSNYEGSCGGIEGESLYSFTAEVDGDYSFSLVGAEFTGVLHLLDENCAPIADACSNSEAAVVKSMSALENVLVVVDSDGGTGGATLLITAL